jgi:hypothetical protein
MPRPEGALSQERDNPGSYLRAKTIRPPNALITKDTSGNIMDFKFYNIQVINEIVNIFFLLYKSKV